METVPQKELRNNVGEVLRRVEAGETLLVTVAGRPVAELSPAHRRRWVSGDVLQQVWDSPVPHGLAPDLEKLGAGLVDPLPVSAEVTREWGRLAAAAAARGGNPRRRQIDLAIAATAVVEKVPLLTHDVADLQIVSDLVDARLP